MAEFTSIFHEEVIYIEEAKKKSKKKKKDDNVIVKGTKKLAGDLKDGYEEFQDDRKKFHKNAKKKAKKAFKHESFLMDIDLI